MVKILIINHYSSLNMGDAAILTTMLEALKKFVPHADFTVSSFYPEIDSKRHKVKVIKRIITWSSINKKTKTRWVFGTLIAILQCTLWAWLYRIFDLCTRGTLQEYARADIIISCGGGFLHDSYGSTFLFQLYEIFLAILLRKPVIIYAQSIGPFGNRLYKHLTKFVLNRTNLITLREEISQEYLRMMGVNRPPIYVTADSAFLLRPIIPEKAEEILSKEGISKGDRPLIGVTARHWVFPRSANPNEKFNEYMRTMARAIDYLIDRLNATVVFIPQAIGPGKDDDRVVANKIFQMIKGKEKVKVITNEYSPEELKGIIGRMDLFLGTRMHSNINSTASYVPTIAIEYLHKTKGIMKMLGQEGFVCDIETLNFLELTSKIDEAWTTREEIKKSLMSKVKIISCRALFNAKIVSVFLLKSEIRSGKSVVVR